jgi:hypothetical protein
MQNRCSTWVNPAASTSRRTCDAGFADGGRLRLQYSMCSMTDSSECRRLRAPIVVWGLASMPQRPPVPATARRTSLSLSFSMRKSARAPDLGDRNTGFTLDPRCSVARSKRSLRRRAGRGASLRGERSNRRDTDPHDPGRFVTNVSKRHPAESGRYVSGFSQTDTCWPLALVNGSLFHPSQRSRSLIPASSAISSSSAGQTYR